MSDSMIRAKWIDKYKDLQETKNHLQREIQKSKLKIEHLLAETVVLDKIITDVATKLEEMGYDTESETWK